MTLLLPNRRACRAMADAFLRRADSGGGIPGGGLLLPKLQPIGEPDEDAQTISESGLGETTPPTSRRRSAACGGR